MKYHNNKYGNYEVGKTSTTETFIEEKEKELLKTMKMTEALNQRSNLLNIQHNYISPYSPYVLWDNENNKYVIQSNKKNFSYVDIESNKSSINKAILKELISKHSDTLKNMDTHTIKNTKHTKQFTVLPESTGMKDTIYNKRILSSLYNAFPKNLRKSTFEKTKDGELYLNNLGIQKLRNIWITLTGSYNDRSLDSLKQTLGGSTNFSVMNHIEQKEDLFHIMDTINYLLEEGNDRGKKGIFIDRAISLLAFLGDTDLNLIKENFEGLSPLLDNSISKKNKIIKSERFKDVYSSIQKLISQPDNNSFLSDLLGYCFSHTDTSTIPNAIEKQCESVINYITELNKSNNKYVYKVKNIKLSNKGILSPEEEKKVIDDLNKNNTILANGGVKTRNKKHQKQNYDKDIIGENSQKFNISEGDINNSLNAIHNMQTGANGEYKDIKVIVLIELYDKETHETKEIGIEIQNNLINNNNNYNQANHNFLESQKHLLSRIRNKGYTTTKHIYDYIRNSILRNAADLIETRNKINKGEKLDSLERLRQQHIYTTYNNETIDLSSITNDRSIENKNKIDKIAHDLLLTRLREGRLCIDNNTDTWKKLENSLYNNSGEFLHIAFRGNNLLNNLETTRLQLNTMDKNTEHMGSIIFYPFGSETKEKSQIPTEVLRSIIQQQAIKNTTNQKTP